MLCTLACDRFLGAVVAKRGRNCVWVNRSEDERTGVKDQLCPVLLCFLAG